jgi:hypothetical protein
MKKQRNNQGSSDSTNEDIFADFEPPKTTDGSYIGMMKKVKATEDHLQQKFDEKLEEVKARLKASKCRVGISVRGGAIQLQATLPPKPDSSKVNPYQQLISLGIPASLDGLKTAEEEANELGRLLARKQFVWDEKYLGVTVSTSIKTFLDIYNEFESAYFKTHKREDRSEYTFFAYSQVYKKYLLVETEATTENFKKIIQEIPYAAVVNKLLCVVGCLNKLFDLGIETKGLIRKEKKRDRTPPSDNQILNDFKKFQEYAESRTARKNSGRGDSEAWVLWQWMHGMIATFGLRPKEIITKPSIDWWLSTENVDNTWKVHEDCKTGAREVFPLHQCWVETFDLKNQAKLAMLNKLSIRMKNFLDYRNQVSIMSEWFARAGIQSRPYDLRHAWAIRAHMLGIPIKVAADNLGHSVQIHTNTYQKWLGRENRKIAINQAIAKKSEVDLLKDEVTRLTIENERLKLENERFRLMVNHPELTDR